MQVTQKSNNNQSISDLVSIGIKGEVQASGQIPVEVFPVQVQELVLDAKKSIGFNQDYFLAGILSTVSTCIGGNICLNNGSYTVHSILWIAIVGTRGSGKTHPLVKALDFIRKKDSDSFIEYEQALYDYNQAPKDSKPEKPIYRKTILEDFTPEKLADTLQYNSKGILIYQDELMKWICSFDRYNKAGEQQQYLSMFNGGVLSVDRLTRESIRVEHTNVNILGGIQPEILQTFANNNRSQDGFLDRILFVYPKNLEPTLFTGKSVCQGLVDSYNSLLNEIWSLPSQTLKASKESIEMFKNWQNDKVKLHFDDISERAIQAKMETYVWRIALVLEVLHQAANQEFKATLSEVNMQRSIQLVEYFRETAYRVHERVSGFDPLTELPVKQLEAYRILPEKFKRSEVVKILNDYGIKGGSQARFLGNKDLFVRLDNIGNYKKK